jgi:hypothetical protein
LKPELKNEAVENQGDRLPGQPEDEFSDEDQMVGLILHDLLLVFFT